MFFIKIAMIVALVVIVVDLILMIHTVEKQIGHLKNLTEIYSSYDHFTTVPPSDRYSETQEEHSGGDDV